MEDYRIKSGLAHIRFRAWPCPDCHQPPAVTFDQSSQEFQISCCGYSLEGEEAAVVLELWNDFGKEKHVEMEDKKEKEPNDYSAEHQLKTPAEHSQDKISDVVENLRKMLIAKNQNYGNSAFRPPVLLPDLPAEKAIFVRMSDKVARLAQLTSGEKDRVGESIEDTLYDLAGYCVLAVIAMEKE